MRLIDADALNNELIEKQYSAQTMGILYTEYPNMRGIVLKQPTIDPESLRPKGRWEKSEDDYCGLNLWQCSLCHEEWCFEIDDDIKDLNYNYCPNCGALMDLEDEE